jgi:NADH dehydrogenase
MIVVAGGTGVLGRGIVSRLLDAGRAVRVLTRDPARALDLRGRGAEVVAADLRDIASLRRGCVGATHIVTTANAFMGRGNQSVAAVDGQGTRNLVSVAKEQGVRQFVFTSALLPPEFGAVDYFAAKFANEAHLRASGVPFTVLKPTAFMDTWAQMIVDSVRARGVAQIFGPGTLPVNYVATRDVAAVAALTIDRPDALDADVEIGGPENLTMRQVVDLVERIAGRPVKRTHLPVTAMRLLPFLIRPFNPGMARAIQAGYYTATVPQPFDPAPMLARYPIEQTTMEDWVRARWEGTPHGAGTSRAVSRT